MIFPVKAHLVFNTKSLSIDAVLSANPLFPTVPEMREYDVVISCDNFLISEFPIELGSIIEMLL